MEELQRRCKMRREADDGAAEDTHCFFQARSRQIRADITGDKVETTPFFVPFGTSQYVIWHFTLFYFNYYDPFSKLKAVNLPFIWPPAQDWLRGQDPATSRNKTLATSHPQGR